MVIYDAETLSLMTAARHEATSPLRQQQIERAVRARVEMLRSGLLHVPRHVNAALTSLDPLLRARWDYSFGGLCVERWSADDDAWLFVTYWPNDERNRPIPVAMMIELLAENDMQRYGAAEWLRRKRASAAKVREQNEKAGTERVLAAVDSLSTKSIKNFINVERAVHTGDRITAHGSDQKSFERMAEASRKTEASVAALKNDAKMCRNPGMHPRIHRRK